jgi:hypothetical protein
MGELADADSAGVFELPCDETVATMPMMTARPMRARQPQPFLLLFTVMPPKVDVTHM